jgi:hypothetical protein
MNRLGLAQPFALKLLDFRLKGPALAVIGQNFR